MKATLTMTPPESCPEYSPSEPESNKSGLKLYLYKNLLTNKPQTANFKIAPAWMLKGKKNRETVEE